MLNITEDLFNEFKNSRDTLRIYKRDECIFKSERDVLTPLVEYISKFDTGGSQVIILDKIMGNAAALLSVKAGAKRIYSPLGSEPASRTLSEHNIEHYLEKVVPFILARNGKDMCPMEKLSLNKDPDGFYEAIRPRFNPDSRSVLDKRG